MSETPNADPPAEGPRPESSMVDPSVRSPIADSSAAQAPEGASMETPVVAFQQRLKELTPRVFLTWIVLAANVGIFLLMVAKGVNAKDPTIEALLAWGADYAPRTLNGEAWRLFTATFVHIGWIHLLMNMIVLASVGPFVERVFGNVSFVVLYVASGLAGSLTTVAWSPEIVSAGASGAIFGLYGGVMGFALRNKHSIPRAAFLQLLQRAGTFVVFNVVYAFSQKHIDMAAHVGGLVGGFLAGLVLARPLTPEGASRRTIQAAIVGAVTAAAVAITVVVMPKPVDLEGAFAHVDEVQVKVIAALKKALETEDPDVVAACIEQEVLPPWDAEIASLEKLPVSGGHKEKVARVLEEMKRRRSEWADFGAGLRGR